MKMDWGKLEKLRPEIKSRATTAEGFTVQDYAARYGISLTCAGVAIRKLVAYGDIEQIGKRPGRGGKCCFALRSSNGDKKR